LFKSDEVDSSDADFDFADADFDFADADFDFADADFDFDDTDSVDFNAENILYYIIIKYNKT